MTSKLELVNNHIYHFICASPWSIFFNLKPLLYVDPCEKNSFRNKKTLFLLHRESTTINPTVVNRVTDRRCLKVVLA